MATTIRNEKLFCLNCGGDFELNYPIAITDASEKMKLFDLLHKECKPTWKEPVFKQNQDVKRRAIWWLANGRVGMSSKTIWLCFMEQPFERISHPYDPDDFSRCYDLLEIIPEWKPQLEKLKPLSKQWSNLVDNWEKLTEMYELNKKENWMNPKKIGMYEFMQTLIR